MTALGLASQFNRTVCWIAEGGVGLEPEGGSGLGLGSEGGGGDDPGGGAGVGAVEVATIPSPERLSVAGEESRGLRNDMVADAGPFTCGANQTWKVTD